MDLILKFLHIPLLCTDCNPIMDCNASDLIMWLLTAIFQNSISIHINVIIQLLSYFLLNFIHFLYI